jgi:hypothetical protein
VAGRVRIGTCADPAEAALVKSAFAAFEIDVVIAAEHHASLLGAVGSSFLSLDIWVDGDDAEEAAALLRDLRNHGVPRGEPTDLVAAAPAPATPGEDGEDADDADDASETDDVRLRTLRRRRASVAVLVGCFITFGTAHMAIGAWRRGLGLAALEVFGFWQIMHHGGFGPLTVVAAIVGDLIGTLALVRAASRPALPAARVRRLDR